MRVARAASRRPRSKTPKQMLFSRELVASQRANNEGHESVFGCSNRGAWRERSCSDSAWSMAAAQLSDRRPRSTAASPRARFHFAHASNVSHHHFHAPSAVDGTNRWAPCPQKKSVKPRYLRIYFRVPPLPATHTRRLTKSMLGWTADMHCSSSRGRRRSCWCSHGRLEGLARKPQFDAHFREI